MDPRAAKLALARQKLKSHQEKKLTSGPREDNCDNLQHETERAENTVFEDSSLLNTNIEKVIEPEIASKETKRDLSSSQNTVEADVNITEILIANKRNLEMQISELQSKMLQLDYNYGLAINDNNNCKLQIHNLEQELKMIQDKYLMASQEILAKDKTLFEMNARNMKIADENNNYQEQLELTKSVLTSKETENVLLQRQLNELQSQIDATQLQLQQLTNGSIGHQASQENKHDGADPEELAQKISSLEEQLKTTLKEREQTNFHYEHYVRELNDQLKIALAKNQELSVEVHNLSARENSLVDQISDMEIRLQKIRQQPVHNNNFHVNETNEFEVKYTNLQVEFKDICNKFEELQKKYDESEGKLKELLETKVSECNHENISMSKLNADIANDKVAAQRATEQNRKLKIDLQELEEAFVKISRDKLELTEKVTAEKYLNRELTIKLAEIEEKAKDMHIKLHAKDEEMIRLQQMCREQERKIEDFSRDLKLMKDNNHIENDTCDIHSEHHNLETEQLQEALEITNAAENIIHKCEEEHQCLIENDHIGNNAKMPKQDAMLKLQERFLKIMSEVADLSDEKHRLEHIILQLQNETDTICEYVALYQQQRSLLKKRDEERSAQIKIFQMECELLKNQLEELSGIIIRLAQDTELAAHFQVEPRQSDLAKVMNLLRNLKNNTLIDPHRTSSELNNFYPCSCCSGKLIDV